MAHSKLSHDLQAALDCDLCEGHVKVDWHCLTCPANLCEKCHVLHTSRKNFRKHKVITRANLRQARRDEATPKCSTHANNDVTLKCVTCQVSVCVECVPNAQNGHQFESLDAALGRSRENLAGYIKHLEDEQKVITAMMQSNSKALEDFQAQDDQTKRQISETWKTVKALVDEEMRKMIQNADKNAEKAKSRTSTAIKRLQTKLDQIAYSLTSARNMLEVDDAENIDKYLDDNPRFDSVSTTDILTLSFPKFQATQPLPTTTPFLGTLTFDTMTVMGLSRRPALSDVKVIKSFKAGSPVTGMRSSGSTKVWCSHYGDTFLRLYDKEGKKVNVFDDLNFEVQGFVLTHEGNFIVCDLYNQSIKQVTSTGRVSALCSTSPLKPWGICLNDQQQPVVCLGESLVVYSPDCQTKLCDFTHDQHGQPLFIGSYRVDGSGDSYCVVDFDANKIVVLDKKGRKRWTYRGRSEGDEGFNPSNICCDKYQNVIVADTYNTRIHLLDKDGQFIMCFTDTVSINRPRGLCVMDNDVLWVGGDDFTGTIHQISYMKH